MCFFNLNFVHSMCNLEKNKSIATSVTYAAMRDVLKLLIDKILLIKCRGLYACIVLRVSSFKIITSSGVMKELQLDVRVIVACKYFVCFNQMREMYHDQGVPRTIKCIMTPSNILCSCLQFRLQLRLHKRRMRRRWESFLLIAALLFPLASLHDTFAAVYTVEYKTVAKPDFNRDYVCRLVVQKYAWERT